MAEEVIEQEDQATEIPEDYAAFTKFRDNENEAPAVGDKEKLPSESTDAEEAEVGQTALDPDSDEEEQQEEELDEPQEGKKGTRLSRRMRTMTGTIAELRARLDGLEKEPEADEEVAEEVASSTETIEDTAAQKLVRPRLADFEDTDDASAWDQYEIKMEEYNDAKTAKQLETALAKQANDLEIKHARASANEAWNKAASRFPDYNEIVREEVKISAAMEAVMRMDPESGTALAYYMGQHPEESERIAKATLAANEQQWGTALARAGMELGTIRAKLTAPGKATPPKSGTTAASAKPPTKTLTTASKPPTQIRGGVATPKFDVTDEDDAADYAKWNKAREAQLKRK